MSTQEAKQSRFPSNESFPVEMQITDTRARLISNGDTILADLSFDDLRGATVFTEFVATAKTAYERNLDNGEEIPLTVDLYRYDNDRPPEGGSDIYISDENGIEAVSWISDEWWDVAAGELNESVARSVLNAVAMAYEEPTTLIEKTAPENRNQ